MTFCSFCGKSYDQTPEKVLVTGKAGAICRACLKWAGSKDATIAACAGCTPVEGRHAPDCTAKDDVA